MQTRRIALVAALVLIATAAVSIWSSAYAADQTVLGKTYVLKDPKPGVDATVRGIVVLGKELTSDDSVAGDPATNGATVEVVANGASPGSQVFTLPGGLASPPGPGWKVISTGFSYKDANGANGPVKTALIKKSGNGTFVVKVTIKGANGPITLLPPAPGTDGGMKFTINGGDSYCVTFGGAAGGLVKNAPSNGTPNKLFKVVNPTTETGCPTPPPPPTTSSTSTSSSTTSTSTSSTTTSTCPPGPPVSPVVVKGALVPTVGRFNYNLMIGLPAANSACNTNFPGTHACALSELQAGEAACDLAGLKDTNNNTVTSFWAIDGTMPPLQQCNDSLGSGLNWEYGTAHTASRGRRVDLNNAPGILSPVQPVEQCFIGASRSVGCCQ